MGGGLASHEGRAKRQDPIGRIRRRPLAQPSESYQHFLSILDQMNDRSLEEIISFQRIGQIASGHFHICRLPSSHITLDRTSEMRYGLVDELISES
jgi:hypothetical protein